MRDGKGINEREEEGERGAKGTFVGDRDSGCVECIQVSNLGRLATRASQLR